MWNRILCLENRRRHDRYIGCVNYAILQRAKHVVRPDNLSGRLNNIGGNVGDNDHVPLVPHLQLNFIDAVDGETDY